MTSPNPTDRPQTETGALNLAELFKGYLTRQAQAHAEGLNFAEAGEVSPYEAVPVQPVDPKLAWNEALAVVKAFGISKAPAWPAPPDWPTLVANQEPALDLAFGLGNFPQLVRNVGPLLTGGDLPALRGRPATPAVPALAEWAAGLRDDSQRLLAVGVLRLAGQYDAAAKALQSCSLSGEWKLLQASETAALAWHRGECEQALELWKAQPDSVPVNFNRGMAALFLGRSAEAVEALTKAVAGLPENGSWYHLGSLYLTLASARK
jgi:hypothetical protein